jgi:hypothetical protein
MSESEDYVTNFDRLDGIVPDEPEKPINENWRLARAIIITTVAALIIITAVNLLV